MRIASGFAAFLFLVALVLSQPIAAQQAGNGAKNNGTPSANGNQGTSGRVEKFKVKQEFGPQSVSRRGDRTTIATPPGQGSGAQGNNNGSSSSTDKFKQEFGPQSVPPRGDRTTIATPPGQGSGAQGNNNGSSSSTDKFKQEFGPQTASRRGDRMSVDAPQDGGGSNNGSAGSGGTPQTGTGSKPKSSH